MQEQSMFFMVWNPEGRMPTRRHPSYNYAIAEARRLATSNAGQEFFVLRAVAVAKTKDPVDVIELDADNGMPF